MRLHPFVVTLLIAVFTLGAASLAHAKEYRFTVAREDSNQYRVIGEDLIIETWGCSAPAVADSALLRMGGLTGAITFLNEGTKCSVIAVYALFEVPPGRYRLTLTRERQDWYRGLTPDVRIHTVACSEPWNGEKLTLEVDASGSGVLYDDQHNRYSVAGIYIKLSL